MKQKRSRGSPEQRTRCEATKALLEEGEGLHVSFGVDMAFNIIIYKGVCARSFKVL